MAKPKEFLSSLPILTETPPEVITPGRISDFYYKDGAWRYKTATEERQLITFTVSGDPEVGQGIIYTADGWQTGVLPTSKRHHNWTVAINSNGVNTSFLRRQNGTPTDRLPFPIAYPCRFIQVSVENRPTDNDDRNLRIYKNGSTLRDFLKPTGRTFIIISNLNEVFQVGDLISLQCRRVGSGNISYPGATLYFEEI